MKTVVITGCSRGLGLALAEWFAVRGHKVLGCGRSARPAEFPHDHEFCRLDVTDDPQVAGWARDSISRFGPPHLLINNAGAIAPRAPFWEVSRADFDRVIDINVKGVANVLRHFLPAIIDRGNGMIVNFSSGRGRGAAPQVSPYGASKWAIEGLTASLAQELPAEVGAVALNPGIINTEMLQCSFGTSASDYAGPDVWVERAGPFIDSLSPAQNGQSLTVPA